MIETSPTPPKEGLKIECCETPRYITADPSTYFLIKDLRDSLKDHPTLAEEMLWKYLCNKKIGHKIRRQHIVENFITDFICIRKKVVIEIDGKIHLKQQEEDLNRTERLNEIGYEVIRYKKEEVYADPKNVANKIKKYLDSRKDN